jgi:hypothetical protein
MVKIRSSVVPARFDTPSRLSYDTAVEFARGGHMEQVQQEAKNVAVAICRHIDEDEAFIAETQFTNLLSVAGKSAALTDEGQFEVPADALTYASLLVPFIGGIFADAVKDLAKEQIVAFLKRWLSGPMLSSEEVSHLKANLDTVIDHSKATAEQRNRLKQAIAKAIR